MIAVDRNRLGKNGKTIRPDKAWEALAQKATADALQEGADHVVREEVYRHDQVKIALEELFHRKCAYCETRLPEFNFDVEHYRPKGRVAEDSNHPGYYWLAYKWENLLPSCVPCNQSRRDPPTWDNPQTGAAAGKADQFPLRDSSKRALTPNHPLADEEPLLLNPCLDDPEAEFRYEALDGWIITEGQSDRLGSTVEICNLNRKRLREERAKIVQAITEILLRIQKARMAGNTEWESGWAKYLQERLLADSSIHAGVARAVVRDPTSFGIQGFNL